MRLTGRHPNPSRALTALMIERSDLPDTYRRYLHIDW